MSEGNKGGLMHKDSRVVGTPDAVKSACAKLADVGGLGKTLADTIGAFCDAAKDAQISGVEVDLIAYREVGDIFLSLSFKRAPLVQE